jgi:23S rRNA (cytidine1920-2'-O)/16S rRNA (cytidine1409-2'-O)-methyltransferase
MKKVRIDKLLVEKGLVASRERARALIMAGDVIVDDRPVEKAGATVDPGAPLRLRRPPHPFVGRGGVKLRGALDAFALDPGGLVCADVGASTGGFTDCLLSAGAARVYSIDVDCSQLDWKLQSDPRVTMISGNARYLEPSWLAEPVSIATVDVSFISLARILPAVGGIVRPEGRCLALVKPQFELGRDKVGRRGVVTSPVLHQEAVQAVISHAADAGFRWEATSPSPIKGKEGNQEFFVLLERS